MLRTKQYITIHPLIPYIICTHTPFLYQFQVGLITVLLNPWYIYV